MTMDLGRNSYLDDILIAMSKADQMKTWEFLTSLDPVYARQLMDDYEHSYKNESERWNLSEIDMRFE